MVIKSCPIENTLNYIGKKWSINILRDMFMGKTKFTEFLKANPQLSTKMLALRLRELEDNKLIQKNITNTHPVNIEYSLTGRGRSLNKIMYELAIYAATEHLTEFSTSPEKDKNKMIDAIKSMFLSFN